MLFSQHPPQRILEQIVAGPAEQNDADHWV